MGQLGSLMTTVPRADAFESMTEMLVRFVSDSCLPRRLSPDSALANGLFDLAYTLTPPEIPATRLPRSSRHLESPGSGSDCWERRFLEAQTSGCRRELSLGRALNHHHPLDTASSERRRRQEIAGMSRPGTRPGIPNLDFTRGGHRLET